MDLIIGILEDKLRKFSKGTDLHVSCGVCHHSAMGNETIISIEDNTDQTYGYITLNLNNSSKAEKELSKDKEVFYEAELLKLNKIIEKQKRKIDKYEECIKSNIRSSERILKY